MRQQCPTPQPDRLVTSTANAPIALSESSLDLVSGGDVTVNKAKTADKAYQQIDAYVKG